LKLLSIASFVGAFQKCLLWFCCPGQKVHKSKTGLFEK
jgi:hypothetical protein